MVVSAVTYPNARLSLIEADLVFNYFNLKAGVGTVTATVVLWFRDLVCRSY